MITMQKFGVHGRTGNMLFQWAFLSTLARKHNTELILPDSGMFYYFENPPKIGAVEPELTIEEPHYEYNPSVYEELDYSKDINFLGYWQSERYWNGHVLSDIKFKQSYKDEVKEKFKDLFDKPTIAIGIRRTDYLKEPGVYHQLPVEYFITALLKFENWKDCNLIFITDDRDYCRIHFECLPNAFFPDTKDIEAMCLMSMMDNIIMANSTFYWWAAKLGNPKRVIQPTKLFAGELLQKYGDINFYSPNWEFHEATRLDLRDVCFLVPVFYDHSDRRQNLDLSICMIQKSCDTNIIVGEQGGRRFEYTSKFCTYHHFEGMNQFHRTKMLNDMAMMADTPIVANWDCDVIIPPMQFYLTCEAIRNGTDMVFPYDGRFARFHRLPWFKRIEKLLDIGVIGNTPLRGKHDKPVPVTSVGGAIFFNKESFIDGGMENENMVSFGPEDHERHVRFLALGFKVERVGGCLYHIDHFVGVNSSTRHPHFKKNNDEFEKIKSLSSAQLKEYVDSWGWRHIYTARYYRQISEGSVRSASEVFKALAEIGIKPKTVIDIGCGIGEWNNGIKGYVGVDYKVPRKSLLVENYIECNLETDTVKGNYDLCICLEVLEHLTPERAEPIVEMLCGLSKKVLFSAAIPFQGGTGHLNERFQTYWAGLFAAHGYYAAKVQPDIRDNPNCELWYRQNIVLYEKGGRGKVVDFVLPEYYLQIVNYLKSS